MSIIQLGDHDGSWRALKDAWKAQCDSAGEDFSIFAQGTFMVLDQLAARPEQRAGIYAVLNADGVPNVICQVNYTPLPQHPEPIIRVRMVTVCPDMDFGVLGIDQYVDMMVNLFYGIWELSEAIMTTNEIKFHLKSPEDFQFFRSLRVPLAKTKQFEKVEMQGAWLYVTKRASSALYDIQNPSDMAEA
jgi:hypothetical protein